MAYITKEMLCEFAGKFPEEESQMPQVYADSAMETVAKYLGYDPEMKDYEVCLRGDGTDSIVLPSVCQELVSVEINGQEISEDGWEWRKNYLSRILPSGESEIFSSNQKIKIKFRGGYDPMPQKIVITALQLATLYWESSGGNLAVSSTSYADMGTRVFNNFHEERFLEQINEWRIYNV